jgi:ABC-type branched-subunit amino acid transport system ATPase component/ABC-type branched-subunit amino acid transport system permease subunit
MTLALLGWSVPLQVVFNGLTLGLGYAVIAAGIVLIFRCSGIINFAQAAMGAFGVASFVVLFQNYHLPYPLAAVLGVAGASLLGVATELLVVRRLFNASRVVLLIATVGVAQLIAFLIFNVLPPVKGGPIPVALEAKWARFHIGDSLVVGTRQTSLVLLVAPVLVALGWFLTRTRLGLHIRAVADNPTNARLVGVSPRKVSTLVWGMAAAFAAYTQIAVAPIVSRTADELAGVSSTGLLLRALVIAMAARMRSITVVVIAGLALGAFESVVAVNVDRDPGAFNAFLLIGVLVLVLLLTRGRTRSADTSMAIGVRSTPIPESLRGLRWIERAPAAGMILLLGSALVVPIFVPKPSQLLVWTEVLIVAIAAISLTLLTGWAGQLSLGHFAFAGVGGLAMLAFTRGQPMGLGLPIVGNVATITLDLPWLAAMALAIGLGVFFAVLVGLPALRVKGLFLAVTTLAFGFMAGSWMFNRAFWNGGRQSVRSAIRERPELFGVDFGEPRNYYYLCLAFLVLTVVIVSHLRRTGAGRNMIAVRDNEAMTAASTVSPTRAKLTAFAVSGGLAALAGCLYAYLLPGFNATGDASPFSPDASLRLVAIVIIGGVGSIGGAILGTLWVLGLPALFGASNTTQLLTTNVGLLVLLLYLPGGLIQVVQSGWGAVVRNVARRREGATRSVRTPSSVTIHERRHPTPAVDVPWLEAGGVSVRFDGVNAVDDVSIHVGAGETVGLIGQNGSGKSTLLNAISGFVPHEGSVTLLGRDVTHRAAHQRHAIGLGRGFQDAALFPSLSVRETVLIALEARRRSLTLPSLLALPPTNRWERAKRTDADDILDLLQLGAHANQRIEDLSTGTRRVVELACLVANGAKVLLLDEPTGGIAQREAEAFVPVVQRIQRDLDASMLVIEHDMPMIMAISTRIYCLEAGRVISSGAPHAVGNDPLVIASYLGTDDRAVVRSNQPSVLT